MSITGLPGQGPVRVGIPIDDLCAGILLAQGILMALIERETVGRGAVGAYLAARSADLHARFPGLALAAWPAKSPSRPATTTRPASRPALFPTADGQINIAASGDHMFRRFCEAADAMQLLDDPDYETGAARSKNRKVLNEKIAEITKKRPAAYWVELMNEVGVPCGPLYTIDQTFADPQVQHLEMARPIDHPRLGALKVGRPGDQHDAHARAARNCGSRPPVSASTPTEILRELGYNDAKIADLRARDVV